MDEEYITTLYFCSVV